MPYVFNPFTGELDYTAAAGGGGSGTVTSVSVTTANGASGSVANPTTTPAISLSFATQTTGDNSTKVATTAYVDTTPAITLFNQLNFT